MKSAWLAKQESCNSTREIERSDVLANQKNIDCTEIEIIEEGQRGEALFASMHTSIELEWEGNTMNDGIADAVMAVLLTVESSPAAVKYSSSKQRHHHHHHNHDHSNGKKKTSKNAHAELNPQDRFARLCMFLEEQFGESITPIERPKLSNFKKKPSDVVKAEDSDDEEDIEELEAEERARLASLGIPVPGLEIKVDKHVAKLWLENLEVECANRTLQDRVKAVVERAVETVAPLWTVKNMQQR